MIVAIYKNGDGSSLEHHRTISQFNTASRHFASILLRRLVSVCKSRMCSNEAGFYPYRDYFDQILNLPEILVCKYTFHTLMQFVFPDYRVAFDSVDRVVLRCCLSLRCVRKIHFTHQICALEQLKPSYCLWRSFIRIHHEKWCSSEWPTSGFRFIFVIEIIMETALLSCENNGLDVCSDRMVSNLVCRDDIIPLTGDGSTLEILLDRLKCNARWMVQLVQCFGQLNRLVSFLVEIVQITNLVGDLLKREMCRIFEEPSLSVRRTCLEKRSTRYGQGTLRW